jgi:hypothetical protein
MVAKNTSESKPEGRRKVRFPTFKLTEDAKNDLRDLKIKKWIPEATEKNEHLT